MTDLKSLVDAVFDNPLEETPRNMLRDFCAEEGRKKIHLHRWPPAVVLTPSEAKRLAKKPALRQLMSYSTILRKEACDPSLRNCKYGLPPILYRVELHVAEVSRSRKVLFPNTMWGTEQFLRWTIKTWNLFFSSVRMVSTLEFLHE